MGCLLLITVALVAGLAAASPVDAQDAAEIAARADARGAPVNLSASITLTITSPNGDQRVIRADSYQKQRGAERQDRLFVFTFPPNVRDTALLVHSNTEQGEDSMWMYLPAMDRIKRVDLGSSGGGYFLGSDFTFRDLVSRAQSEYVRALLPADGDAHFVVEVRGRTPELQRTFGYSREEHFIRKDNFTRERIVFYDLAGDLLKELIVQEEHAADGYAFPSRVRMLNHQTGHVSEILFEDISLLGRDPGPVLHPALPAAQVGCGEFHGGRTIALLAWHWPRGPVALAQEIEVNGFVIRRISRTLRRRRRQSSCTGARSTY